MVPPSIDFHGLSDESAASDVGSAFGSPAIMPRPEDQPPSSFVGSPSGAEAFHRPRQRDRRQAVSDLLTTVTRALERRSDAGSMRGALEAALSRVIPVHHVRLREAGSRWAGRREDAPGLESVAIDVPGSGPNPTGSLEATFEPGCRIGQWEFQLLSLAAQVGALVLEIERSRLQLTRFTTAGAGRPSRDGAAPLIGSTAAMQALRTTIERVAATNFTVLLEGESGVGKELVARQIHDLSRRRNGPFVAINCAALVETLLEAELFGIEDRTATGVRGRRGKFEAADGGTLFLDEVGDLSLSAQAKLLRAIQDLAVERVGGNGVHRVDIRIIAATNRGLADLVNRHLFRPDLFYRLSGVDVRVPPLRERPTDVLELAAYFLERHRTTRALRVSSTAAAALTAYDWPGNVRELERLMERAVTLAESDVVALEDLPPAICGDYKTMIAPAAGRNDSLRAWASRYARLVLGRSAGNKREACRVLNISYHTLQSYLRFAEHEPEAQAAWEDEADETREVESA
jgi:DNA-binding NtrC family response regulator